MGTCLSVSSCDQIHDAESDHGHENAVAFFDHGDDDQTLQGLGSVYSMEGSKGLNQDSALLYLGFGASDRAFCGVFDGHGKNGHVVSEMVRNRLPVLLLSLNDDIAKLSEEDESAKITEKWQQAITNVFKATEKEIKLQAKLNFSCSGTTAVVAIRLKDDLILANLGDSRAVLGTITENGIKAVQLTTDQKPGLRCEAERIRACKGRVKALKNEPHVQRVWLPDGCSPGLAMSRAFGDFLLKDYGVIAVPEISSHRISPDDQFVVLASDGIWDVMSNEQVAEVVWEAAAAGREEAAARVVVEAANEAWKRKFPDAKVDDCSVVCLFLHKNKSVVSFNRWWKKYPRVLNFAV